MRKYMAPCIAADRCFENVDDLGTAAHTLEELVFNLREIFTCIRRVGSKLTMSKCEFASTEIKIFGKYHFQRRNVTKQRKGTTLFEPPEIAEKSKIYETPHWFFHFQFFRPFIPQLSEKLLPFYNLLKNPEKKITDIHH